MQINPTAITAERSQASENGTARGEPEQSSDQVVKLLKANTTLVVWLIFLAIGGGILALYYAQIHYLPDIDWKAALIYLFAASMIGGVMGLLLTVSLFIPGFIWSEFIIFDRGLQKHFSYKLESNGAAGKDSVRELCIRSIMRYLGRPFLIVLLLSHIALLLAKATYWAIAAGVLLGITFWLMRILFQWILLANQKTDGLLRFFWSNLKSSLVNIRRWLKRKPVEKEDKREWVKIYKLHRQTFKYSSWFTLSVLLSQISMYLIYRLSGSPPMSRSFIALTLMCTSGVLISNHVVAVRYRLFPRQAVIAAFVAAGLLLFTADTYSSLSKRLMSYYGVGGKPNVSILITDRGGRIVTDLGVPQCGTLKLCNVEILSKVGDEYFLKAGEQTFTLPKSEVISFSRPEEKSNAATGNAQSALKAH